MIGITSYGAYIPLYRLNRAEIGCAWDMPAAPGEKAVANHKTIHSQQHKHVYFQGGND